MKARAVFLDRDGVLNEAIIKQGKPYAPLTLEELVITHDSLKALQLLKNLGYLLIGATNQPDVARGLTTRENVEAINNKLMATLPLDAMLVCFHDNHDNCDCRKPLPGLLLKAALDFNLDLPKSYMIGDRWKDVLAGQQAQCKTVWLDKHYEESKPVTPADFVANSLMDAAIWISHQTNIRDET